MQAAFGNVFAGMPVLVTGHTGFKGSWLSLWLKELGADVSGFSVDVPTTPSNFEAARLGGRVRDRRGDISDLAALCQAIEAHRPRVVFHLAAQPLVRAAYARPKETFDANAGGTVNVLEALRLTKAVRAAVFITTDKCYENREWLWGYRETDALGGRDPYSASKAMAELAIAAYRQSFFPAERYAEHQVAVASARAGNVIGGGDWAPDRILPDSVRALAEGRPIDVRNPRSARPWQFVLEPLSGYLWLAARLLAEGAGLAEAWNFGPPEPTAVSVAELVEKLVALWGAGTWQAASTGPAPHEAGQLRLSWEKAAARLGWRPLYAWPEALAQTVDWYKTYYAGPAGTDMYALCARQIARYTACARAAGVAWAQ